MDTARLKRFATEARNILLEGVTQRLLALGFDLKTGDSREEPIQVEGGAVYMGDTVSEDFYRQWARLNKDLHERKIKDVIEEAAYTWFNRLVAIRILAKQEFIEPILQYDNERIPMIVAEARQGRLPEMDADTARRLNALLEDDSKTNEQFSLLIIAFCHSNPIISKCFGSLSDYSELLLPDNILGQDGFVNMLNDTDLITDEDYKSAELIGWLYQFYISEKKDEVFAKKGKVEADEIPAATQIFTPNWIVKYMVQNTVGRIYLDNNPYATELKANWKYLVEGEPTPEDKKYKFDDLTELKVGDLACGSGHILVECFELLFELYTYEGYSRKDAVENIFKYNLTGIDLDKRAQQLATFALVLKACQKDRCFIDAHAMPNVLTMPHCDRYTWRDMSGHFCCYYGIGAPNSNKNLDSAFQLLEQAENLGSIMIFNVTEEEREFMKESVKAYEENKFDRFDELINGFRIILALTEQYSSLIMNPPYMGGGNMNSVLSTYVKRHYEEGKSDLFSTFMLLSNNRLSVNGKYGMINMQSWMFLSSFELLRESLLKHTWIESMMHLGPHTFDELSGEVVQNTALIVCKTNFPTARGNYFRLVKGRNCSEKETLFLKNIHLKHSSFCYPNISQTDFFNIPGNPIGYWISNEILKIFHEKPKAGSIVMLREGLHTGDNNTYLRFWHEISFSKMIFNAKKPNDIVKPQKWVPYNKGGFPRKWFGNNSLVVKFDKESREKMFAEPGYRSCGLINCFKEGGTWSSLSSGKFSLRYYPEGFMFDSKGQAVIGEKFLSIIAQFNTNVYQDMADLLMPTLDYKCGDVKKLPYVETPNEGLQLCKENIVISKTDWDAHETSWDFKKNELVNIINTEKKKNALLDKTYRIYRDKWESIFLKLHSNEEKLNQIFIEELNLTDYMTSTFPFKDTTILLDGEIKIKDDKIEFQPDIIIKQLISYAVGCMMGRYSVDKEGLILANHGDGLKEFDELVPDAKYRPDDDGIIPLMDADTSISDNASTRFKKWLSVTFGEDTLVENLNFVEKCLGKSIDSYFEKDFWKDHKKMYQNRPIYWLFSSKKGAFQCLVYMHRMNPYTAERVRTQYLLPHIEGLLKKQQELNSNAAALSTAERKQLDNIGKQIDECREYHDRLHVIADEQINFDLDDGVVVNYAKFGDVLAKIK